MYRSLRFCNSLYHTRYKFIFRNLFSATDLMKQTKTMSEQHQSCAMI